MIPTVEWKNGIVMMLDQTKLPFETVYQECSDYQTVARGIKELWVRGAPAIGVSAAMGLALGAKQVEAAGFDDFWPKFETICAEMDATRPTAVNLFWAIERMMRAAHDKAGQSSHDLARALLGEAERTGR